MREVLHPVAYTVLVVILQLLSQVFYAAREGVKSLNPKFFGKSVRGDIVFLTGSTVVAIHCFEETAGTY